MYSMRKGTEPIGFGVKDTKNPEAQSDPMENPRICVLFGKRDGHCLLEAFPYLLPESAVRARRGLKDEK